jgi:hypothetical protein
VPCTPRRPAIGHHGLASLDLQLPGELARRSPFALAWKDLSEGLDRFIDHGLAAA